MTRDTWRDRVLPGSPTASVVVTSVCRQQMEGLDEFDLAAGYDAQAITAMSGHRGRGRAVVKELKETARGTTASEFFAGLDMPRILPRNAR